jgi:hypothetical protein
MEVSITCDKSGEVKGIRLLFATGMYFEDVIEPVVFCRRHIGNREVFIVAICHRQIAAIGISNKEG